MAFLAGSCASPRLIQSTRTTIVRVSAISLPGSVSSVQCRSSSMSQQKTFQRTSGQLLPSPRVSGYPLSTPLQQRRFSHKSRFQRQEDQEEGSSGGRGRGRGSSGPRMSRGSALAAVAFSIFSVGAVASKIPDDESVLSQAEELKAVKKKPISPIAGPGVRPQLAKQLALQCIENVPGWQDLRLNQISVSVLSGGLSNQLFEIAVVSESVAAPLTHRRVVVRLFNEQSKDLISREVEAYVTQLLNGRDGIGADVLHVFPDDSGRIETFIRGEALNWDLLRSEYKDVANLMARVHLLKAEGPLAEKRPQLYQLLADWLQLATSYLIGTEDADVQVMVRRLREEYWGEEISFLQEHLARFNSPVVFSHNDMQAGNFMKGDGADEGLTCIDFEYSGYNFRGFDLGNYFCELYLDNFHPAPPYFRLSLERFPDAKFRHNYVRRYLASHKRLGSGDPLRAPVVSEEEVQQVAEEALHYMMASHLLWSFWAVVQARSGEKANFGYIQYADARLSEFLRIKRKLLMDEQRGVSHSR